MNCPSCRKSIFPLDIAREIQRQGHDPVDVLQQAVDHLGLAYVFSGAAPKVACPHCRKQLTVADIMGALREQHLDPAMALKQTLQDMKGLRGMRLI